MPFALPNFWKILDGGHAALRAARVRRRSGFETRRGWNDRRRLVRRLKIGLPGCRVPGMMSKRLEAILDGHVARGVPTLLARDLRRISRLHGRGRRRRTRHFERIGKSAVNLVWTGTRITLTNQVWRSRRRRGCVGAWNIEALRAGSRERAKATRGSGMGRGSTLRRLDLKRRRGCLFSPDAAHTGRHD